MSLDVLAQAEIEFREKKLYCIHFSAKSVHNISNGRTGIGDIVFKEFFPSRKLLIDRMIIAGS